jgi:hypothetical protein
MKWISIREIEMDFNIKLLEDAYDIALESSELREEAIKIVPLLENIRIFLEKQRITKHAEIPKILTIREMMENIYKFNDKICSRSQMDVSEKTINQLKTKIEFAEFTVLLSKQTEKINETNKEFLEILWSAVYWYIKYSEKYRLNIPHIEKLQIILKKSNFTSKR